MPVAGNLDPIDSYQLMAAQNAHHLHPATNMVPISYSLAAGLNPGAGASYETTFMDNGQQIPPQPNGYVITNADTLANQSTVPISPCSSQYGVFIAGTGIRGSLPSSVTNPTNIPYSSQQYSSQIPNHNLYALSQQPPVYGTIPRRVRVIPSSVQQPPPSSLASSSSNSSSIHQSHGHQPTATSSSNNITGTISSISTSNSMSGNSAPGNGDVYNTNGTTQSVTQV